MIFTLVAKPGLFFAGNYISNNFSKEFISVNLKSATMRRMLFSLLALLIVTSFSTQVSRASTVVPTPTSEIVPKGEPTAEEVRAALEEFKSLSRKERKERIKEVRKEWKSYKKEKRSGKAPSDNTVLLCILAVLLPPLAVYLHQGEINNKFWISLLLTLLFWIPGVIYALVVILGVYD